MIKRILSRLPFLSREDPHAELARRFLEPSGDEPLMRLHDISKVFLSEEVETHALRNVDLQITRGEFVTVSGPSGCGKSTLLHILGLLESPTSGGYHLNGMRTADLKLSERAWLRNKCVGFIFQSFNLIGDLNVFENVETPLTYVGMPAAERRAKAHEALARVGMQEFKRRFPSSLTGGEQQRVAVARAIVGSPLILMADEPTGNLDSANGEIVMSLLQELHDRGSTLFLVTHNPQYAQRAQRTLHLLDGRIVG